MCIVAPARVLSVRDDHVLVDQDGRRLRATTLLVPEVAVGDWILIGSGAVLRRLEPADALDLLDTIRAAEAASSTTQGGLS
jgi:hydrogenase assembly chaperone HypC/HupF